MANFRYRHFIYLDSEEILNIAAVMEGGVVIEELHTLTKGFGGRIGLKFGFAAMGADLGGQGNRQLEREWKLLRTAYATSEKVLDKLNPAELTRTAVSSVPENTVVRCDIDLRPLQLRSTQDQRNSESRHRSLKNLVRPWWNPFIKDPAIKVRRQNADNYGERQLMQVNILSGSGNELAQTKVLLILKPEWLLDPEGFSRRATIVGQVVGVIRKGEELVRCGGEGPGYKFQPKPPALVGGNKPPETISAKENIGPAPGSDVSERDQQSAAAQSPDTGKGSQTLTTADSSQTEESKRWRIFGGRSQKGTGADEGSADSNTNPKESFDESTEERWEASAVLRPIVIFK